MRNFTLLFSLLFCAAGANAQTTKSVKKVMPAPVRKAVMAKRAAEPEVAKLWRPKSEEHFILEDEEWLYDGATTFTYDLAGNILTETMEFDGEFTRTTYTYNENNKKTSTMVESKGYDSETWLMETKTTYTYDDVLPNIMTSRLEYKWDDVAQDWVNNNTRQSQKRDITRDAKGNITSVELTTSVNGTTWTIEHRTDITYDEATNKAISFDYRQLDWSVVDDFVYGDPKRYKNIEWENTDGQISADEDLLECVIGANRFKSADLYEVNGEEETLVGHIEVAYTEDKDDFVMTSISEDGLEKTVEEYKTIDEFGGYVYTSSIYEKDEVEEPAPAPEADEPDNTEDTYVLMEAYYETMEFDDHGNITLEEGGMLTPDNEREIEGGMRYNYTYDNEMQMPTEVQIEEFVYIYSAGPVDPDEAIDPIEPAEAADDMDPDGGDVDEVTGAYEVTQKIVYSDYYDVLTAINQVTTGANCNASAIYNLQGVAVGRNVKNLPAGLYIVKQAGRVQKMIKK